MYGVELMIIIVATVASSLAGQSRAVTVVGIIMFWRVVMGVGIGGDYPLSAIITSEFATKKRRGAMMASVFAMQGFGILGSAIVALIVLAAFRSAIIADVSAVDYCWRIVLGCGAIPGIAALYFRLTIPETPRYTMDVEHDVNKATSDVANYLQKTDTTDENDGPGNHVGVPKASWSDFTSYFGKWKNGKVLLGTSMSWFALDIAFYGIGLNNGIILSAIGYADTHDADFNLRAYNSLKNMALGNIIITIMGTVPGYWVTVAFVDKWGRKPIQIMGFAVLTVLFIVMGAAFNPLKEHSIPAFIVLFTLLQVIKLHFPYFFSHLNVNYLSLNYITLIPVLPKFWSQHNNIHRSRGSFPNTLQINWSWYISCIRKTWSYCCPSWFLKTKRHWWTKRICWTITFDLCGMDVYWWFILNTHS